MGAATMPEVHVFGGTLAPRWLMPRLYGRISTRLAEGGPVRFHPMQPFGGLGRTDHIVESFEPILSDARDRGVEVRLAGHSLGGVVAWALAHQYPDVVDTVEMWGAPLRGTLAARALARFGGEAKFLRPCDRWLRKYDQPLNGPTVRSFYTACDELVLPPRMSSHVEGDDASNHFLVHPLCPHQPRRSKEPPHERLHKGLSGHLLLPLHPGLNAAAA
jgi:pimeloyl-ACP methyl ester carboxylesterase